MSKKKAGTEITGAVRMGVKRTDLGKGLKGSHEKRLTPWGDQKKDL